MQSNKPAIKKPEPEAPIVRSVTLVQIPTTGQYLVATLVSQGDKILSIEQEEPNDLAIARDTLKVKVIKEFFKEPEIGKITVIS